MHDKIFYRLKYSKKDGNKLSCSNCSEKIPIKLAKAHIKKCFLRGGGAANDVKLGEASSEHNNDDKNENKNNDDDNDNDNDNDNEQRQQRRRYI